MSGSTKNPAKAAPGRIDRGRLGYARVSTHGQALEVQLSALDAAAVAPADVFAEKKSGKAGSAGRSGRTGGPAAVSASSTGNRAYRAACDAR